MTKEQQTLAEMSDGAVVAWEQFAAANEVSVDALLEALAPILVASTPGVDSLRSALDAAVEMARAQRGISA